jgi:pimeloyl-ACP methyl ester carboxylesterase
LVARSSRWIEDSVFHKDVAYIEELWQQVPLGNIELPLIDVGVGRAVVFVPMLEHLEFVYARQIRVFSQSRRAILYRRQEMRITPFGLRERVEELYQVLNGLELEQADLIGHGYAAMVLFEFALRYPQRCRSLTIIAQGADERVAFYPFVWLIHQLYSRLPLEEVVPSHFVRDSMINDMMACNPGNHTWPALPRHLIDEQFDKIRQFPLVYKSSILPLIHYFDIRKRLHELTMPILLINRADDAITPESKTYWLAKHLPRCAGYHIISGREHLFTYSRAETVTPLIEAFLTGMAPR